MKAKAAFYFLILCRQLLSLERYRRKKGVEVKGFLGWEKKPGVHGPPLPPPPPPPGLCSLFLLCVPLYYLYTVDEC
jgi:hypothetical protein